MQELVAEFARTAPGATAIEYDGGEYDGGGGRLRLSWAALDDLGRRAAGGLAGLGLVSGDRLALWLPNVPAWIALYLGCARLGVIAVCLNTRLRSDEVGDIIGRTGARALALWPGYRNIDFSEILAAADPAALATLEALIVYDEDGGALPDPALARFPQTAYSQLTARPILGGAAPGADCGGAIFTTSGTTSRPKLVRHGQAGIVRHALDVARDFGLGEPSTSALQALPLCGVFGFSQAMATLASGRPMVLMPEFRADRAAALVRDHGITHINATDGMYRDMLDAARGEAPFPSLRLAGFAAFGSGADGLVDAAEARGLRLTGLYGMSEVLALFARQRPADAAAIRGRAGGWPVSADASFRVRDPQSGNLTGHGVTGELEVRGPSRMVGYFGDDAASEAAITGDGFVRTGDLAHGLADGSFVFHARMGDALRLGGFLVNPAEIEAFVINHKGVTGCQVVGVEQAGGTRPFAFVTLERGAAFDQAALTAHCAAGMARFKVPVAFHRLEEFPVARSPNGAKIQRARLREMALSADTGAKHKEL